MPALLTRSDLLVASSGLAALSGLVPEVQAQATRPSAGAAGAASTADPGRPIGRPMPELDEELPLPPERRVGFALVGLGAYALEQIAPNLRLTRRARLAAVVSGNADKARTVASAYGLGRDHVYSYDDFDRIAQDETVDVVYVILPNAFHREWTERAFAAGKHVLCEKPMAVTNEDGEAMIAAGRRAGKWLMVGYRVHFEPHNLKAKEAIASGEIGEPRIVVADHMRPLDLSRPRDQWRARRELAGGGSLYDIGIYSVNGARFLLGEEPTEVRARLLEPSGRPEVTVEEGVEWAMTFPSGAVASCTSGYREFEAKRVHVQGARGEVTLDPESDYYENRLTVRTEGVRREHVVPNANQFVGMLDEMAAAVQEDREPQTPGEEGLRDVRILEAIYRAAETGEAVALDGR